MESNILVMILHKGVSFRSLAPYVELWYKIHAEKHPRISTEPLFFDSPPPPTPHMSAEHSKLLLNKLRLEPNNNIVS